MLSCRSIVWWLWHAPSEIRFGKEFQVFESLGIRIIKLALAHFYFYFSIAHSRASIRLGKAINYCSTENFVAHEFFNHRSDSRQAVRADAWWVSQRQCETSLRIDSSSRSELLVGDKSSGIARLMNDCESTRNEFLKTFFSSSLRVLEPKKKAESSSRVLHIASARRRAISIIHPCLRSKYLSFPIRLREEEKNIQFHDRSNLADDEVEKSGRARWCRLFVGFETVHRA